MALAQVFTITESEDGATIYVNDETGAYDAVSNVGGYGAPNTERADVALVILGNYKATAGDAALTFASHDPEDVTQFSVPNLTLDGYYQFKIYTVAKKTGAETPAEDDFVYDFDTDELQRWDGAAWVAAEDTELDDNDLANNTEDWPHIPALSMARNYLNKLRLLGSQSAKQTDLEAYLKSTEIVLYGVIALFGEGSYTTAQEEIEKYQSRVDTILELT